MFEENVEKIIRSLLETAEFFRDILGDVKSVIVFGSAARPEDFVPGVSDIDVLVVVGREPKRRSIELSESSISISAYRLDEIIEMCERGDPLIFMLRYSRVIYDDGSNILSTLKPRITDYTLRILRRSVFAALGLALQKYFYRDYRHAVSHTYHAARHLIRYLVALSRDPSRFPVSDREVIEASPDSVREFVKRLIELRRREVSEEETRESIIETFNIVISTLNLVSPDLREVLERFESEDIIDANVCEKESEVIVKLEVLRDRVSEIYDVRRDRIDRGSTIFCFE